MWFSVPKAEPSPPGNQNAPAPENTESAKLGARAPDFDLPDLDGKRVFERQD